MIVTLNPPGKPTLGEVFKSGDRVPSTGVYKVTHKREHAAPHDVIAIFGDVFPPCRTCGTHVTFEVVHTAVHVRAHPQFM